MPVLQQTAVLRLVAFLSISGCCLPLAAQSWDLLNGLRTGDEIRVQDTSKQRYKGKFTSVTPQAIVLNAPGGEVTIEKTRVRRVEVRSSERRLMNTVLWAGVGLAVGVVVDQTLGQLFRNETGEDSGVRALTYVAPAGVLGGIAGAFPAYRTIYKTH